VRSLEEHLQAYADDLDALQSLALVAEEQGDRVKARLAWTKLRAQAEDQALRDLAAAHLAALGRKSGE
jgi:hypothetical protein